MMRLIDMHGNHIYNIIKQLLIRYPNLPFKIYDGKKFMSWASGPLRLSPQPDKESHLHSLGVVAISIASPSQSSDLSTLGTEIEVAFLDSNDNLIQVNPFHYTDESQHFDIHDFEGVASYITTALSWR